MKTRHFLRFTSLLFSAALSAQSAAPADVGNSPAPGPAAERPRGLLLRAIDTNHDGTLSPDEIRLAPIALTAFDLDEDGFLLPDEINPASMARARRMMLRLAAANSVRSSADESLILALDANHDGVIQPLELANAASSLRQLDANGDGSITAGELQATPISNASRMAGI